MAKSVTRWWALVITMFLGFFARGGLAQDAATAEQQAFEKARAQNTEAAYRDFLRRYPEGQFTADAFRDLVSAVVKMDRPIFQPAFDNQLLVEGLMPAPLEPTLATLPANSPDAAASLHPSDSPDAAGSTKSRGDIASRLLDPY